MLSLECVAERDRDGLSAELLLSPADSSDATCEEVHAPVDSIFEEPQSSNGLTAAASCTETGHASREFATCPADVGSSADHSHSDCAHIAGFSAEKL